MKRLTLLRHATSGWTESATRDFDRPLDPAGRRAARAIGRTLGGQDEPIAAVLASPARRVVETLDEFGKGYGEAIPVRLDDPLYLASAATLLEAVRHADDAVDHLLLVAHDPGIGALARSLTAHNGAAGVPEIYPAGAVTEIRLAISDWSDVAPGTGTLLRYLAPEDVR